MRTRLQLMLFLCLAASLAAQTGGNFDLSHNVIAGGGGRSQSAGGNFRLDGTIGQPSAGTVSTGDTFNIRGGFWSMTPLLPTAANVSISGRVTSQNGRGLAQARLTLTDPEGNIRQVVTNLFGFYRFDDVDAGATYILVVQLKRYQFNDSPRVIVVEDELTNVDFVGSPAAV